LSESIIPSDFFASHGCGTCQLNSDEEDYDEPLLLTLRFPPIFPFLSNSKYVASLTPLALSSLLAWTGIRTPPETRGVLLPFLTRPPIILISSKTGEPPQLKSGPPPHGISNLCQLEPSQQLRTPAFFAVPPGHCIDHI